MKIKKISQRELSAKIGMTQSGLSSAIIAGDFKVSTLEKIAKVLKTPISYFFEETESGGNVNQKAIGYHINQTNGNIHNSSEDCKRDLEKLENIIDDLKEKIKLLEKTVLDKEEIINLLKNK